MDEGLETCFARAETAPEMGDQWLDILVLTPPMRVGR